MRTSVTTLLALALTVLITPVSAAQEVGAPLALKLSCDGGGKFYGGNFGTEIGYSARVYVHIEGASGEILIPKELSPPPIFRERWYPLQDLAVGQKEITARYRVRLGINPVVIDRTNGWIKVAKGRFEGKCVPYDPDNIRQVF